MILQVYTQNVNKLYSQEIKQFMSSAKQKFKQAG